MAALVLFLLPPSGLGLYRGEWFKEQILHDETHDRWRQRKLRRVPSDLGIVKQRLLERHVAQSHDYGSNDRSLNPDHRSIFSNEHVSKQALVYSDSLCDCRTSSEYPHANQAAFRMLTNHECIPREISFSNRFQSE